MIDHNILAIALHLVTNKPIASFRAKLRSKRLHRSYGYRSPPVQYARHALRNMTVYGAYLQLQAIQRGARKARKPRRPSM